jgi:5,10-methylenetetrahydrofolate reductase
VVASVARSNHRSFGEALRSRPLVFEPVPPALRSSPARAARYLDQLIGLLRPIDRLDGLIVPELVDENHEGRPYYRSGDAREFARTLARAAQREVVVNKVVAHLASEAALEAWVRETLERSIHHVVLVGGSSRYVPYPGPPVIEANRRVASLLAGAGGLLGNIAIPQRTGEPHRMVAKARAGASFFTTQILFDSEAIIRLLRDYERRSREGESPPATVLLSFAPMTEDTDAEFVRWLGAEIPERIERSILEGEEAEAGARSVANALRVWSEVNAAYPASLTSVPIGVNVEQISPRHLPAAVEMLTAFAGLVGVTAPGSGERGAAERPPPS